MRTAESVLIESYGVQDPNVYPICSMCVEGTPGAIGGNYHKFGFWLSVQRVTELSR